MGLQVVVDRDDALSVKHQPAVVQRMFEPRCPLHVTAASVKRFVRIEPDVDPVAPGFLRGVAAGIRGLQDVGRRTNRDRSAPALRWRRCESAVPRAGSGKCPCWRRADPPIPAHGPAGSYPAGCRIRRRPARRPCHQAGPAPEDAAYLLQQLVADAMAAGIVDQLELIRSMYSSACSLRSLDALLIRCWTADSNSLRFSSPVSGSCVAR